VSISLEFGGRIADTVNMDAEKTTLLDAMWNTDGDAKTAAAEIAARLDSGRLVLTGNFKSREAELTAEPGDWERK
jgi:hypothetical protein